MDEAIKLAEVDQRSRSNTHRIDDLEKRQDNLDKLATTMSVMANEQEHIKTDVGEIKNNVKKLTDKPAKYWDTVVGLLISGVAGYVLGMFLK